MMTPYRPTAIALHWLMAMLILGAFAMGLYMVDLSISPQKLKLYSWHKWIGVTVFLFAAVRLLWRLCYPVGVADNMPRWQRQAASWGHRFMYVLFFLIPLSGWVYSSAKGFPTVYLGWFQLPDLVDKNEELAVLVKMVHRFAAFGLAGIVGVHIAAACQHQFLLKDGLMKRMWFNRRIPK